MKHARLLVAAAAILAVGALAPQKAEAQLKFGAHAAYADQVNDGAFGLGARVGIDPPLLPFSFWAHGDYYFVDDVTGTNTDASQGYQTFGADAHFSPLPFPLITPYLSGGVLVRRSTLDGTILGETIDDSSTNTGFAIGLGADVGFLVSGTVQIRREFFSDENGGDQWVVRAGITF